MPDSAESPAAQGHAACRTDVIRLSPDLAALVAILPEGTAGPLGILVDGRAPARPLLVTRLATADGGDCRLALLRAPDLLAGGGALVLRGADGVDLLAERVDAPPAGDLSGLIRLLAGLAPSELTRALQLLFDSGPAMLRVQQDADLLGALLALLDRVFPPPGLTAAMPFAAPGLVLCQGELPAAVGTVRAVVAVCGSRVRRNPFDPMLRPSRGGQRFDLMVGIRDTGRPPRALLFFGEHGVCCRRIAPSAPKRLLDGLTDRAGALSGAMRDYVFRTLAADAPGNPAAAGLLRDAQLYAAVAARDLRNPADPVGVGIDLAVGDGAGGLFVKGWLRDPYGAVDRIVMVAPDGSRRALDGYRVTFPRPDVEPAYADSPHPVESGELGFAVFMPDGGAGFPVHQYGVEVVLHSGGVLHPVPPLAPVDARSARDAVLAAVPADRLSFPAIAGLLASPVAALHRARQDAWRPPEVVAFGTPPAAPDLSIIIPLYRNLDYLRFQYAAFAPDPAMAGVDLVFVLDSPEQRGDLEHFLRCLEQLYGLPCRLAVMSGNFGFASACNTGAVVARGGTLVFVNSDVLPVAPGWTVPLQAVLAARPEVAAAGPKLLFDDDSLQHAGLYFDRDYQGRWYNHHYFKGLPRDYPAAGVARTVPGVTAATLMIRRGAFEDVGGFSEDYVVGDFEDSDLCLKLRSVGHEIAYVPRAELYHYERRSIEHHAGYTRTAAGLYNQWLHASRWSDLMEAVMAAAPPPPRPAAVP
ncbi:glycosyltransferase [Azospirillum halopraeferens]|uniref:glycosyltransferase n=1 Tax=Azospirillum halopraeferens TaxID=34010 RepID=UPI0004029CAE|nr:glycosyltransferase [Azospirillum halopraeferens]